MYELTKTCYFCLSEKKDIEKNNHYHPGYLIGSYPRPSFENLGKDQYVLWTDL